MRIVIYHRSNHWMWILNFCPFRWPKHRSPFPHPKIMGKKIQINYSLTRFRRIWLILSKPSFNGPWSWWDSNQSIGIRCALTDELKDQVTFRTMLTYFFSDVNKPTNSWKFDLLWRNRKHNAPEHFMVSVNEQKCPWPITTKQGRMKTFFQNYFSSINRNNKPSIVLKMCASWWSKATNIWGSRSSWTGREDKEARVQDRSTFINKWTIHCWVHSIRYGVRLFSSGDVMHYGLSNTCIRTQQRARIAVIQQGKRSNSTNRIGPKLMQLWYFGVTRSIKPLLFTRSSRPELATY